MPFKSEAQRRLFYAKAERGEIPKKTVEKWERETKDKSLPETVEKKAVSPVRYAVRHGPYYAKGVGAEATKKKIKGKPEEETRNQTVIKQSEFYDFGVALALRQAGLLN